MPPGGGRVGKGRAVGLKSSTTPHSRLPCGVEGAAGAAQGPPVRPLLSPEVSAGHTPKTSPGPS